MRQSGTSRTSLRGQRRKLFLSLVMMLFFSAFAVSAQENYKKYLSLDYYTIDSLYDIHIQKDYRQALLYAQAGREKARVKFGEKDSIYAAYTNNLASAYYYIGDYRQAEHLYLQAINIYKKIGKEHANILNNLAVLYYYTSNYKQAEMLYLESMASVKKTWGENDPEYSLNLGNLASLYMETGNFAQAEAMLLQAIDLEENNALLNNLALLYKRMGRYKEAETLFLKTNAIEKKESGEQHPNYSTGLSNLALVYLEMGDYKRSEALNLQAMNIREKALGKRHPYTLQSLNNLASLYTKMNKFDTSFFYCRAAVLANAPYLDSSFTDWANLDTCTYNHKESIRKTLNNAVNCLEKQYKLQKDKSKLELSYAISQTAIRLNERIRNEFITEDDKLRNLASNNWFIRAAVKEAIELKLPNYEEDAFSFAEMDKGILLLESAKTASAQQFGNLPDSLVQREKELQKKQSTLNAQLLQKKPADEKDKLLEALNDVHREIDIFTKMLKTQYPQYSNIKYNHKTITAKNIQMLLDDETALLEYLISDSAVYVFYIDKKQLQLAPIYLSNKILHEKIKDFHAVLSNYQLAINNEKVSYGKYVENAHWFYKTLVEPVLSGKNAKDIKNLLIVPDGKLGHLPFETFLVKAAPQGMTNYTDLHYLFKDYHISYHYSAALWKANKEAVKNKNNGQILAMAADYKYKIDSTTNLRSPYELRLRNVLNPLPSAQNEVKTLENEFSGFFACDTLASEHYFKTQASDFAIIHLAMHGLLDDKNPILSCLAFTENGDSTENNFLHAYEISKMKLNADLVVLSACETGYGKFEKGNGIASLAQAFAYAGAPSLIVSLWQVNDYATSEIMKNLYQNLADGMEKDEALQQAKIKYMKEAKGVMAHPAFWSPFILMGNTDSITLGRTRGFAPMWVIGISVALLGGIVFALRKRKK